MPNNSISDTPSNLLPVPASSPMVKPEHQTPGNFYSNSQDQNERDCFQFYRVGTLTKQIGATAWLIDDYIETNSLTLCFAPPESFKSFFAVDIAASVATGIPWHGSQVKQGAVFYIAGEGIPGLKKRFRAWELAKGVDTEQYPLFLSSGAGDFSRVSQVANIIKSMNEICQQGVKPCLIVIDTLARNFGGGNENDAQAMNQFIRSVDLIRKVWECTILIVHHTGYASTERGRGSSALRAAVDAEYMITRQQDSRLVSVKGTKMKDADRPEPKNFELKIIELGINDHRGLAITSGVLQETNEQVSVPEKKTRFTGNHEAVLQAVRSRMAAGEPTTRAVILDDLKAQGLHVAAFSRWIHKLLDDGFLVEKSGALHPVVKP